MRFVMFGGFLGSGKTTAILRLARHHASAGRRVAVIANDLGINDGNGAKGKHVYYNNETKGLQHKLKRKNKFFLRIESGLDEEEPAAKLTKGE